MKRRVLLLPHPPFLQLEVLVSVSAARQWEPAPKLHRRFCLPLDWNDKQQRGLGDGPKQGWAIPLFRRLCPATIASSSSNLFSCGGYSHDSLSANLLSIRQHSLKLSRGSSIRLMFHGGCYSRGDNNPLIWSGANISWSSRLRLLVRYSVNSHHSRGIGLG